MCRSKNNSIRNKWSTAFVIFLRLSVHFHAVQDDTHMWPLSKLWLFPCSSCARDSNPNFGTPSPKSTFSCVRIWSCWFTYIVKGRIKKCVFSTTSFPCFFTKRTSCRLDLHLFKWNRYWKETRKLYLSYYYYWVEDKYSELLPESKVISLKIGCHQLLVLCLY